MLGYNINDYIEIDYGPAYIKPTNGNLVKVTFSNFRGKFYTHIREYYYDGDTDKWFPTKSGYALLAEGLENVIELLQKASFDYDSFNKDIDQLELLLEE